MDQVDRLERTDHHLELDDLARRVPLDDVDAVDDDAVDLGLELEHGIGLADDFAHIAEAWVEEDLKRGRQIGLRECLAALRGMNDRRQEHGIRCEQSLQAGGVVGLHQVVPGLDGVLSHRHDSVLVLHAMWPLLGREPRGLDRRLPALEVRGLRGGELVAAAVRRHQAEREDALGHVALAQRVGHRAADARR